MISAAADGIIIKIKPCIAAAQQLEGRRGAPAQKEMQKTKVSAGIVTYGGYEEASAAARSILQQTKQVQLTLYLIDNASPDDTAQRIEQEFSGQPGVEIIRLEKNLGFGGGHNAVLDRLESEYHVVANPDILLDTDAISALCAYLDEHPEVVMVTPRLYFPDGREQYVPRRSPSVMALLSRQLPLPFLKKYEDHYLMRDEDLDKEQELGFCTGCFFVIRTEALRRIGGFDQRYFMYVEDADLTREAMKLGKVVYWPGTKVIHAWHRIPSKKLSSFLRQLWSMGIYFRKWGFRWGFSLR